MKKIKYGFAIFWRIFALDLLVQFTIYALLESTLFPLLLNKYGEFLIKLKPSIFLALFAIVLFVLCNEKLISINRFVWQRVTTIKANWISIYKNYTQVALMIAVCNIVVALLLDTSTWVTFKFWVSTVFLLVPIVMAVRMPDQVKNG